jgi:membrane protein
LNAAAAHTAFFIILSFVPCVILLFSLLQFANVEQLRIWELIQNTLSENTRTFLGSIIGEAYQKTTAAISLSALAAVWSAGRGMMALTLGLQWIFGIRETRNYFAVRLRATLYTVILMLSIIMFLLLGVFGNALLVLITLRFPMTAYVTKMIMDVKNIFLSVYAVVIFSLVYRFVPGSDIKMIHHMPGAILAAAGWMLYSYAFSVYIDQFHGFSNTYGSLTTIILIMLWLYFGMYITLVGAEFNQLLAKRREKP